ncbi:hypothetical protein BH160DRAFT_3910 [Burkholderia sp. H160]|nr:hypothetical protein BH160DRAFT_3910 [Burkholderia sp. H160]
MFFLAASCMALSVVPLLREPRIKMDACPSFVAVTRTRPFGEVLALSVGFAAEDSVQNMVWPFYLFAMSIMSVTRLGLTYSVIFAAMLLITHGIGRAVDRSPTTVLRVGALWMAAMNVARAMGAVSPGNAAAITLMTASGNTSATLPFDAICYQRAHECGAAEYILFRETWINLGAAVIFAIGALANSFSVLFWIGAGASLGYLLFAGNTSPERVGA